MHFYTIPLVPQPPHLAVMLLFLIEKKKKLHVKEQRGRSSTWEKVLTQAFQPSSSPCYPGCSHPLLSQVIVQVYLIAPGEGERSVCKF